LSVLRLPKVTQVWEKQGFSMFVLRCAIAIALAATSAFAQTSLGRLIGQVNDSSSATVPGADIEIRKATGNKLGLQDAMRGVISAGGNHEQDWSIARILATADKAVGLHVLTRLYNEMGAKPVTPDLAALWRDLGLRPRGDLRVAPATSRPIRKR